MKVQAQALLQLTNWADMREVCMRVPVPKGSGKTVTTQIITGAGFREWTEGSALAAAEPTLASKTLTLKSFGDVCTVTDLLANTSAINFVENIGQVHGDAVRSGIFQYVTTQLSAGAGGTISAASGSTLQFGDVVNGIKKVASYGFQPDYIVTSPSNAWTAFTTTYAVTQFTGALADLLRAGVGKRPNALGLDWYVDPYWDTVFPAAQKKLAYVGCKGRSSIWGALQDDPLVEVYRVPTELQNYIITHIEGGAVYGIANSICSITHAS